MRRYLYLLSPVLVLLSVSAVWAQTLTTSDPAPQKGWELLLKTVFSVVIAAVGPIITGFIKDWPPWAKMLLASLGTTLVGFGAGSIPDFPVTPESGAEMGLGVGAVVQAVLQGWLKRDPSAKL